MLLFDDTSRFINDSHEEFGKMFVSCITLSHPRLVKIHNITEQLMSNAVSAQIFLTL